MAEKLLYVINDIDFFLSHRLPIAQAARDQGYEVHVAAPQAEAVSQILSEGFCFHKLTLSRSGGNPIKELFSIISLLFVFYKVRPSIAHLVTIKPVLYGGIAARFSPVKSIVCAVSGLGSVFTGKGGEALVLRKLVLLLYRFALRGRSVRVIFQNSDDKDLLCKNGVVEEKKCVLIRGAGVDLCSYTFRPEPPEPIIVVMAARLLRDKGVFEFVEAARILNQRRLGIVMRLVGAPDVGNPTSISDKEIRQWNDEGVVEIMGYRKDISKVYENAHIVCLPSYREGLPKSLIEAAACGRVVVTTDVPGCRDAIEEGLTGLAVPVNDAVAIADAIEELAGDSNKRVKMGAEGRKLAEKAFDIKFVVKRHLDIYQEIII